MFPMCITPCLHTLIGTTWLSRDLRSIKHINTNMPFPFFIYFLFLKQIFDFILLFIVEIRFFKESSEEEREHAEKLMKYQVKLALYCMFELTCLNLSTCRSI